MTKHQRLDLFNVNAQATEARSEAMREGRECTWVTMHGEAHGFFAMALVGGRWHAFHMLRAAYRATLGAEVRRVVA